MSHAIKKLPKSIVEITCEIHVEEIKKELESAAHHISEEHPLSGYRPGKAPYEAVKNRFGEMMIYEHALPDVIRKHYVQIILENHLHTFGEPKIDVTKLVPGNPITFTATVSVVPSIISLADFKTLKVTSKTPVVEDKDVDSALKELQRMQTKELRVARAVQNNDKIVVDMDLSQANVPLEGGQTKNHGIYLDEDYYVPGLKEHVLGLTEGAKKTFTLKFPENHYQKNLAGKDIDFALTLKEVYELQHPELDDTFAQSLRQTNITDLKNLIRKNIQHEADEKEKQRVELEILEKLSEQSKFEEVPDVIINAEIDRMLEELKHSVVERGLEIADYLKNIKKTVDELKLEFSPQAIKRIKTAILLRELGEKEKIEISDAELLKEVEILLNTHSNDAEAQKQIRTDDYQDYLRSSLRNKKVLTLLHETVVQKA